MIHTNIGYGYSFDDETKTLKGNENIRGYGFFSTFTLMLITIINVYKDLDMIVENIDGTNLLHNLDNTGKDMYHHFFHINVDYKISIDKTKIHGDLNLNEQHTIYRDGNMIIFKPFFEKYFNFNDNITNKIELYKSKYKIDFENTISVVYRDTDKWTDLGGFNYISPALYWRLARNLKQENPNMIVLIQTENPGVKKIFNIDLKAIMIEETLTSESQEYPTFLTLKENKLDWAESYIASLWINSKSKYLITYTGNSGFFLYLMRGNTKNMYQEITFTKSNINDFFVFNA